MEEPTYKHDCENCVFVPWPGQSFELYICPQNGNPTLLKRRSSEPSGYESIPIDVLLYSFYDQLKSKEKL